MKTHSKFFGGSIVDRRLYCAGSHQAELEAPEEKPSEDADEGNMLHDVMELLELNEVWTVKEMQPLIDEAIGQDFGWTGHPLTEDHIVDKIAPAMDAYWSLHKKYVFESWFIEQQVNLSSVIPGAFGTLDFGAMDKDRNIHLLDYKFGDGIEVEAEGNKSCGFYTGGLLHDPDPDIQEVFSDPLSGDVYLHIIQPRRGFGGPVLKTWKTDIDWVEDLLDACVDAAERLQQPDAPRTPGDWCRWCRARSTCPERKQIVVDAVNRAPDGMTTVELSQALKIAEQAIRWGNDIFSYAQSQAEKGVAIPGWKLVQKQARRKWKDADAAEAILKKSRVKFDAMYEKKLRSPTQIEKTAPNVYSKKLAPLIESRSSGVTLVPDSDRRAAVQGSMELLANALPDKPNEIQEANSER